MSSLIKTKAPWQLWRQSGMVFIIKCSSCGFVKGGGIRSVIDIVWVHLESRCPQCPDGEQVLN